MDWKSVRFSVEERKETLARILINVYIYDDTMHISPALFIWKNVNARMIDYATWEISYSFHVC